MIIRKYQDRDGVSLEININETSEKIIISSEFDGTFVSIELDYNDAKDLSYELSTMARLVEPVKSNG